MDIAGWLRANRANCGLTQFDLAARARVSVGSISRWERGTNHPSLEQFRSLCLGMDCSADEALGLPPRVRRRRVERD